MPLYFVENDITEMNCDAIVNAANEYLMQGGGVCGAIFRKAGSLQMRKECDAYGKCETGCAVITSGCKLNAKYVIHGVGPVYYDGNRNERNRLYSTYLNALKLASEKNLQSIAFPLISSGIYGYPKKEALEVAVEACTDFLKDLDMKIYLVFLHHQDIEIGEYWKKEIACYLENFYETESEIQEKNNDLISDAYFESLIKDRRETFSEMLIKLIRKKGVSESYIYHKANIDRKHFSKIRNNKDYFPKKSTVLSFAIALELNITETEELLKSAGYILSDSIKEDLIIKYFINHKMFDLYKMNEILFYFHLNTLD